jgi:hypothetical protein
MPQIRNKEIQMSYEVVGRMLETCLDADLPLLIEGGHGIGKSEIVACAAKRRAIGFLSLAIGGKGWDNLPSPGMFAPGRQWNIVLR